MVDDPFTAANRVRTAASTVKTINATVAKREQLESLKVNRENAVDANRRANEAERRAQETFERSTPTPEQLQLQSDITIQQLQQTQNSLDKTETFNAFDRYVADSDVKHLNNLMQNPRIKEGLYGEEVVTVNKVDAKNDELLIRQTGLDPEIFTGEAADSANYRYVKVINNDGSQEIVDMTQILAGTGYLNHVSKQRLNLALDRANLQAKLNKSNKKGSDFSTVRNDAAAIEELIDTINTSDDPEKVEAAEIQLKRTRQGKPTAVIKNLREAEKREVAVLDRFGGEEGFFNTDFSKRENLLKVNQDIEAIEKLKGIELDTAEKKRLRSIRSLIDLAGVASSKLTSKQTGIIDNFLLNTKKFVTDNVKGIEGAAAYESFKNTLLRSFGGTALTTSEINRLNKALGSLGNQLGPVLTQLKVSTQQIKQELETIASTQNPTVSHVRLGATQDKVNKVIGALDQRIDFLTGLQTGNRNDLELIQSNDPQTPSTPDNPGAQGQATNEAITKTVDRIKPKLEDFNFSGGSQ